MKKDCKNCEHLGRDCPKKLMLLSLDEIIDWCLFIMAQYKLTHDDVSKMSRVPKGTLDRILAKQSADCRYSTIHAIVCALFEFLGISAVCVEDVTAEVAVQDDTLRRENADLRAALNSSERELQVLRERVTEFEGRRDFLRAQVAKKDEHIDRLSNTIRGWRRTVKILSVLLGVAVLLIIASLVIDKFNPDVGFFWRSITG